MGDRPMAACTRYPIDDLDTSAIHISQQKMTKRQWMEIRPMVVGARHEGFSSRAETNLYLKQARKMGKRLITASMQRTDFSLMAVLQQTSMPGVATEQQTNTCP